MARLAFCSNMAFPYRYLSKGIYRGNSSGPSDPPGLVVCLFLLFPPGAFRQLALSLYTRILTHQSYRASVLTPVLHRTYTPRTGTYLYLFTLLPACDHERPSERHAGRGPFLCLPRTQGASQRRLPLFLKLCSKRSESEEHIAFSCRISPPSC